MSFGNSELVIFHYFLGGKNSFVGIRVEFSSDGNWLRFDDLNDLVEYVGV